MNARRLILLVCVAALGVLALACSSAPALAAKEYIAAGSFGESCSGAPCGKGQFNEPAGIAVNFANEPLLQPTAGDVYVIDAGDARVERFSSADAYLGQFNGAGSYEAEGKVLAGPTTPAGSFSFSSTADANGIAVDGSNDPLDNSLGDVYVADVGDKAIDKFSATGRYEGQLKGTCPARGTCSGIEVIPFSGELQGVAVDPAGNLWVYEGSGNVDEFSDTGAFVRSFNTGRGVQPGLAVDAKDNVYPVPGSDRAAKFEGAAEVAEFGSTVTALTANLVTGEVLIDTGSSIERFAPVTEREPSPIQTFAGLARSDGLAVDSANAAQAVYASQREADDVEIFDAVVFPTTEPASGIYETDATLNGMISPEGVVTECKFEYGSEQSYGQSLPCEQTPAEINALGKGGTVPVSVSAALTSLQARTTYDFRLIVTDAGGTLSGKNSMFYTFARPSVESENVSASGATEATITAQIDAGGETTGYRVEYGSGEEYGSSSPEVSIGDPQSPGNVAVHLAGLSPGTSYHARLVAKNALGTVQGSALAFTTPSLVTPTALALPDSRAYELVSSPDDTEVYLPEEGRGAGVARSETNGEFFGASYGGYRAATDGDALAYMGESPASGIGGTGNTGDSDGNQYLATRGADGWEASDISLTGRATSGEPTTSAVQDLSADLSVITFMTNGTALAAAEPQPPTGCFAGGGHPTLFSQTSSGYHALLTTTGLAPGEGECPLWEAGWGISADDSHILLNSYALNLYDATGGALHQVNVLPSGDLDPHPNASFGGPTGAHGGFGEQVLNLGNDISADGSRVFWTDLNTEVTPENPTGVSRLFVRENDAQPQSPVSGGKCTVASDACTAQIDAPEPGCGACVGGGGEFWTASEDGSKVFLTDERRLTADSTAAPGEPDLYLYEVGGGVDGTGALTDLTVDAAGHADAWEVAGASKDGSYVYFLAKGILTEGPNAEGAEPVAGQPNLYVSHGGSVSFIASGIATPVAFGKEVVGREGGGSYTPAEVVPSGQAVAFFSTASLTHYDNKGLPEIFVYQAGEKRIRCASCNPTGEPPVGSAETWEEEYPVSVPRGGSPAALADGSPAYAPRWINEAGTEVFFNTNQPLAPADTNRHQDVYEWESDGSGACTQAAGCVAPLSDVEVPHAALLIEAGASGRDVFFTQRASLTPRAIGETVKLYDARVGGGFPETRLACTGTGCQGVPPAPPIFSTPASVTFSGVGNFEQTSRVAKPKAKRKPKSRAKCGRGRIRKHNRCVRAKSKKQRKKSSSESSASKRRGR